MIEHTKRLSRKKISIALCIACALAVFFFVYSFIAFQEISGNIVKLNSPDETANYYFSKLFAEHTEIGYAEPLLRDTKNFIHPRSMTGSADGTHVVPVSFLGMVLLYGTLGKIFGSAAILFFTPVIAVLGSVFFYFLLAEFFSKRIALLSSALLLIHPAYWYYSAKGMFPNVLFIDFIIIGLFILWRAFHSHSRTLFFLSGLCIGAALMVRLSELPWVFLLLAFIWICKFRIFRFWRTLFFICGVSLALTVLLVANQQVYGNIFSSGYAFIDANASIQQVHQAIKVAQQGQIMRLQWWQEIGISLSSAAKPFVKYLFPFGIASEVFLKNFFTYGISLFWWFSSAAAVGVGGLLFDGMRRLRKRTWPKEWGYLCAMVLVCVWLIPLYGSWIVTDTITGEATIGNSYVRYWLALYCFMIPLAAYALCHIYDFARPMIGRRIAVPILCFAFVFYSFQGVLWEETDGLFAVAQHISEYRDTSAHIAGLTENDAVIFSSRSDKIFFPERRVAQSFDRFPEAEIIPALIEHAPAYYYGIGDQKTAEYISKKYFSQHGLRLEPVFIVSEVDSLYRVMRK